MSRCIAMVVLVCLAALPTRALVNAEPPADDDTRFDAVGAFGHTARLNEGMGNPAQHQWYGSAVLIAPDVVLTAKHLLPHGEARLPRPGAMTVRFRRHEDGTLGTNDDGVDSYHQATIARYILCPDADLMLCILRDPVEHITPVSLDLSGEEFDASKVMLAAWGSTSNWVGQGGPRTELRAGQHTATVRGAFLRLASFDNENREKANGQRQAYITDENTVPNKFDSGGSMFVVDDEDNVLLAGIIATYSGGTWLGRYAEDAAFPLGVAVEGAEALEEALD
ncbi:trypsin-like serine protease [Phycisphaeraceae bacterium D3-23]